MFKTKLKFQCNLKRHNADVIIDGPSICDHVKHNQATKCARNPKHLKIPYQSQNYNTISETNTILKTPTQSQKLQGNPSSEFRQFNFQFSCC